jgi:hypothetical protein
MLYKDHAMQRISMHKGRAFSNGLHITRMSCCFKYSLFLSMFDACTCSVHVGSCPTFDVGGDGSIGVRRVRVIYIYM